MDTQVRAGFVAVRDHIDSIQKMSEAGRLHVLHLITQQNETIDALREELCTLGRKIENLRKAPS